MSEDALVPEASFIWVLVRIRRRLGGLCKATVNCDMFKGGWANTGARWVLKSWRMVVRWIPLGCCSQWKKSLGSFGCGANVLRWASCWSLAGRLCLSSLMATSWKMGARVSTVYPLLSRWWKKSRVVSMNDWKWVF